MLDKEIYYPKKDERVGNDLPTVAENRQSPDRESMLFKYANSVEDVYAGDFRLYVKKFGDYLRESKSRVYDPAKDEFVDIPVKYAAPQNAFSDNLPQGSTGATPEASLVDRISLPLVSFYLAGTSRDDKRAVDPVVRARYKPSKDYGHSRALVTHSPIPIDMQFQVDIWTEFREHYFQLLTSFYHDFNPYSYLVDVYDVPDETEKLQYTAYVPMFLDSITDNSNFIPGTDRRIVRGTVRITVKGWLTPPIYEKPYVHKGIFNTEGF